ncbi:MAG: cytochrome P450 [Nannocystis sp.]|nr:cytochrome P450 [Nannocystis sp.]MBA3545968.1 cytochrome P450 [Nannocystis sp.]
MLKTSVPGPTGARLPAPPGSHGLPVLGETLEFLRSPHHFADTRIARFGKVYQSHILGKPTVFLIGAQANHWIFAGEGRYLENEWSPAIRKLLGANCLSLISGDAHKQRRKLLAPHFKRTSMAGCVAPMVAIAQAHLDRWARDAGRGSLAVVPRMRAMVFEIAAVYLLGDTDDLGVGLEEFSRDFDTWVGGLFVAVPLALPFTRFGRAMQARRRLFGVLERLVAKREAEQRDDPSVLSTLLRVRDEHGQPLPRSTIVDEIQLLLFAGHDTTVTSTTNIIYHLGVHPEAQARARAEQDAMVDREYTLESLRAMPWLEAVIKESMRLIPPIGGAFRVMTEDAEYGGFTIPKGHRVAIGPRAAHREAEHWPDPERFDPERFIREADDRPPFAWIPFGGGPRICLGQHFAMLEMHVVLAMLLREFEWSLTPGQDQSFVIIPLPRQRSGTLIELKRRAPRTQAEARL